MANLFSSISALFSSKTEAELALERANKMIAEKTQQAKEFALSKAKLEKEVEAKREKAREELAKQNQIESQIFTAAAAVKQAQEELERRKAEFDFTAAVAAEESSQIELEVTQAKQATKDRVKDFDAWLNQFDEKKQKVRKPKPSQQSTSTSGSEVES